MRRVYVIGSYMTPFGKHPEKSVKDLTRAAVTGVLKDSGLPSLNAVQSMIFSNSGWGFTGQHNIRGQVAVRELIREKVFPERIAVVNTESACASGSMAFNLAWKEILSGLHECAMALGAEKMYYPDRRDSGIEGFKSGMDYEDFDKIMEEYRKLAEKVGKHWVEGGRHSVFMDTYATQAAWHMRRYGTTQKQLAVVASKNHRNGSLNPNAQYRFEVTVEQALQDYLVSYPLTRSMCAPIGDGAAAILCSGEFLRTLPDEVGRRAVRVMASAISSGKDKEIEEPSLSRYAAERAYRIASVGPRDINLAEVHDATAYSEVYQSEMLGFCPEGEGGHFAESGATAIGGKLPINTSGGLISRGHPIGASGLAMINEIVAQLRGEAGPRQVEGTRIGLVENGGGVMSFEEASCVVTILGSAKL